ncbi:N-acetylglucosamine-6-phosphate deacetylase [Rothia sp. P6271]|uniref:N-acetylglucosamine-6-phosphate deacetylase n=1 Tax=Rothia sp. P6271 TaxID=3402659 RepID=UPI003AC06953
MSSLLIHSATVYDGTIGGVYPDSAVLVEDGKIIDILSTSEWKTKQTPDTRIVDAQGAPVVPGYLDIHHHGGGGHAYDEANLDTARVALNAHRQHGTTRSVLSFVTNSIEHMAGALSTFQQLLKDDSQVLGFHAEGPFLHPQHKGAHPEKLLKDPLAEDVERLLEASDGHLRQITLAPERHGALSAIQRFTSAGTAVAVGHTNATYEQAQQAFAAGASLLTHTFNGMNGIHHRAPGPVIAALEEQSVSLEVINDGIHVHPSVVHTLFREAPERIVLVTDAMSAACNPDGLYILGTLDVKVENGVARLVHGDSLAGSTLTMDYAVQHAVRSVGVGLDVAVASATSHAAHAIGLGRSYGRIAPGYSGDILILDEQTLLPNHIYVDGVPQR